MYISKHILFLLSAVAPALLASPLPENAELLASNSVEAHYLGTVKIPCRHRTADCPDNCNHATEVARFRVLKNLKYESSSKYGDEAYAPGSIVMVDIKNPTPGQDDEAVHNFIGNLKVGDKVRFTQKHYYGEIGNLSEPFRPVTHIEKDETAAKVPSCPPAPEGNYSVMPIR